MISYTIKFHSKNFQNSCNQESLAWNFQWNALTIWISWHTFLTGWYLFIFFPVAPFWCTPSVILDFCFILLTTNTAIWANLVGAHRSKLEVEDFIFHVVIFSRETFQTWRGNSCFAFHKKFSGFIFPNFVLV